MLVLTRKEGQSVKIGDDITIRVEVVKANQVRLSFEAPDGVRILRGELGEWSHDESEESAAYSTKVGGKKGSLDQELKSPHPEQIA